MPQYEKFHFVPCIDVGLYCDNKIIAIVSIDYKKMPRFINKNIYILFYKYSKYFKQTIVPNLPIQQENRTNRSKLEYPSIPFIQPFEIYSPPTSPGNSTHNAVVFSSSEIPTNGTEKREREKKKKIVEKRSLAFVQHQRRRVAQRAASKLAKLQSCAPYKRAEIYFQPEEQVARATNRQI